MAKKRQNDAKRRAEETDQDRYKRLAKLRQNYAKRRAEKTDPDRVKRLAELRDSAAKRKAEQPIDKKQEMLEKRRTASCKNHKSLQNNCNIQDIFDLPIIEQKEVLKNINLFHQSNKYSNKQCIVCLEAWPSKFTSDTQGNI